MLSRAVADATRQLFKHWVDGGVCCAADGVAEVGQSFSWGFWYPFLALGRSPLFFYLMHLWVLGLVGSCFRGGSPFWVVYLVWPLVVAALVPLCDRYSEFKQSKPVTSLWRLF